MDVESQVLGEGLTTLLSSLSSETRHVIPISAAAPLSLSVVSIPMEGKIGTSYVRSLSVLELTSTVGDFIGAAYVELCLRVEQAL